PGRAALDRLAVGSFRKFRQVECETRRQAGKALLRRMPQRSPSPHFSKILVNPARSPTLAGLRYRESHLLKTAVTPFRSRNRTDPAIDVEPHALHKRRRSPQS